MIEQYVGYVGHCEANGQGIEKIEQYVGYVGYCEANAQGIEKVEREWPMEKLVRCKECKYRYGDKDEPYCSRINPYSSIRVKDEDYCSWGEKNG